MRPWIAILSVLVGCEAAGDPWWTEDPRVRDGDGDGLTDHVEAQLGLDAASPDTDGDGWTDPEELQAGTPGTNPLIHPYPEGGYRTGTAAAPVADCTGPTGEDEIDWAEWGPVYQEGDVACNVTLEDAFGQWVDLYAFQGRYVVLSICSAWCPPCQDVAEQFAELEETYAADVTFLDVMREDRRGDPADRDDLVEWHEAFELDHVVALADPEGDVSMSFERDGYIPTLVVLDREMRVLRADDYYALGELDELID